MPQLQLNINSDLADVFLAGLAINKVCSHLGFNETQAYQVESCTVEAVTNVIRHSYSNRLGHNVSVNVRVGEKRLDIEVAAGGLSMSPEQIQRLNNGSNVFEFGANQTASLPEGGMGLQIIHELMDEVQYTVDGDVNRLRLTKFVNRPKVESIRR